MLAPDGDASGKLSAGGLGASDSLRGGGSVVNEVVGGLAGSIAESVEGAPRVLIEIAGIVTPVVILTLEGRCLDLFDSMDELRTPTDVAHLQAHMGGFLDGVDVYVVFGDAVGEPPSSAFISGGTMQNNGNLNLPPIDTKRNWSQVQDIICGNRIPDDSDQTASRALVDEIESDLRQLEIHRVQLEHALVAIFTLAIEDHARRTPWFLLRICHQWRTIILSSPSFWLVIHIDDRRWNSPDVSRRVLYQTTLAMLETSLSASVTSPLSVTLDMRAHNKVFGLLLLKVLIVLSGHRARIRHLGCYFRHHEHIETLKTYFFNAPNSCPLLEELDIMVPRSGCLEASPPSLVSASNLRRLRDHLFGSVPNAREGSQGLQYQRLTHLSCVLSSANDIPLVRYLNVNHPHLLLHLTLPSLEALAIFPFGPARLQSTDDDIDALQALKHSLRSMVQRSLCQIRALGLVDRDVQGELLALDALRHVETIAVFHADHDMNHADNFHPAMDAIASASQIAALTRIVILRSYSKMEADMLSHICTEVSSAIDFRRLRFGKACAEVTHVEIWGERLVGGDEATIMSEMRRSSAVNWKSCRYLDDGLAWDGPLGGGMWRWLSDVL
ncbi:hypothetical protein BDZ89DRAFT_1147272 [Hymenopellis radicata]|nr:hypothetical protein BDZ89DRAFT_1147272 [Hymenopellis radicata]